MLPQDKGPRSRGRGQQYVVIGFLLVVVAAASWWVGQRSGQSRDSRIKSESAGAESNSNPQLALSSSPPVASAGASGAPTPVDPSNVGGVVVTSDPPGVDVKLRHRSLNREFTGKTPATLSGLPAGFYEVTLNSPEFQPVQSTFEVVPHKIREMEVVKLERLSGKLQVSSTAKVHYEIYTKPAEGERELVTSGDTPGEVVSLPTGPYELILTRTGWPTAKREVNIVRNMTTEVAHEFPEGGIAVDSDPAGAEVWIKGEAEPALRQAGKTPFRQNGLPAGAYEVVLRHPDGPERKMVLMVTANKVAQGLGSWKKTNVLFTSDPPGATVLLDGKKLPGADNAVTPFTAELTEGPHTFTAILSGLDNVRLNVAVDASKPTTPTVHFPFAYGAVQLVTNAPGANVYLNNALLGQTPLLVANLRPDTYQFLVQKERYGKQTVTGKITQGNRLDLNVQLLYDPLPAAGEDFTNGAGSRMKWVPAIKGWCETTETPQRVFEAVTGTNPSHFPAPENPVENISWAEAMKFCDRLTISERGQGLVPPGFRYRLPGDAHWTLLATGTPLDTAVTSRTDTLEHPAPCGSLKPNALGLFDIRGNVWEWCFDWYNQEVFNREQQENASGKADRIGAQFKILRGGSWSRSLESNLEIGYRLLADPNAHHNYESGFRVVLVNDGTP